MAETDGDWEKVSDLMIGALPQYGQHEGEPDVEHRHQPAGHMDVRSSVLRSRHLQGKAVEQFNLPMDREILKMIPDVGLHVILRSYLTRGCLVERELYGRLAQGHHAYEKLCKRQVTPGAGGSEELDEAIKELSIKQAELEDWRREMRVKEHTIVELKASNAEMSLEVGELRQKLSERGTRAGTTGWVFEERDLAVAQAALEKQVASHAKVQLEQELAVSRRLSDECSRLKEVLSQAEDKIKYLESSDYQKAIIEKGRPNIIGEFQQGPLGKVEVALACKAGCDFIVRQLPSEYQDFPGLRQYPLSVASQVDLLSRFEEAGAGYSVDGDEDEREDEVVELSSDDPSDGADQMAVDDLGAGGSKAAQDLPASSSPSTSRYS